MKGLHKATYVTPNLSKSSRLIYKEVEIGGRTVKALIDSGAEATCCSKKWYEKNRWTLGELAKTGGKVIGVGNVPITVAGRTQLVDLNWGMAKMKISLLVVPTLAEQKVILGMDVLRQLGVQIDTQAGTAEPTIMPTYVRPKETWRIPANSAAYFCLSNPVPEGTVMYEPSEKLPEGLRGRAAIYEGNELRIRIENTGEEDRLIDSGWEIGTVEEVQLEEDDTPEERRPTIPQDLTRKQKLELERLIEKYKDVFSKKNGKIGKSSLIQHEIHTRGAPIRQPYRRQNPYVRQMEQEQVEEMLEQGVVRPSTSPWASPVVMVKKKDGSMRFCVDYRKLNSVTEKDAYPLPRIDDTLESLYGACYFSTLDLKSGYWQVPVKEEHKKKTAFRTSAGRLYEWNRLPFGLCNAPATFSRLMDHVLTGLSWEICLFYLDDIIVFSRTWEEHLVRLEAVFKRLVEQGLTLGASKCKLAAKEVEFLGHIVSKEGLSPNPALLQSIKQIPRPKTVKDVRSFLGLASYYRRFVKKFSEIATPLNRLLEKKKDKGIEWTAECEEAFLTLKEKLVNAPVAAYPDFNKPFKLYTDASNTGLGAILAQVQDGRERIVCCASRSLNKSERNYSATKKECLAVIWGIKTFRSYLLPRHFEIFTDHYSLQWLKSMKSEDAMLSRWAASLEDYDFEIKHRPGKKQGHVDALSRLMVVKQELTKEETKDVLLRMHQDGHLGIKKTLEMFRGRFKGVNDYSLCETVVKSCPSCQKATDYKPRKKVTGHINSERPWDLLSVDIVGPLPRTKEGRRFILTIIDCFSRYTILVPLKDHTAVTVGKALYENVIGYFGVPRGILSDRGAEFRSQVWEEMLKLMDIQPHRTSPYYPQGNGMIERMHRTLGNLLRSKLIQKKDKEWPLYLPGVMMTLNEAPHEIHGYSPNQVVCGHRVRLPVDLIWPNAMKIGELSAFVKKIHRKLEKIRKVVQPFNQREGTGTNPFRKGDEILVVQQKQEKDNKLEPNWKGPYIVTRIPTRHQVEYQDERGTRKVSNIVYCKRYIPCHLVGLRHVIVQAGQKRYTLQNVRDLDRLINKERIQDKEVVTLIARISHKENRDGFRLAERMGKLLGPGRGLESWIAWEEVKKRCGHRLMEEGMVCNTVNERSKREKSLEINRKQTCLIDPYDFITLQLPASKKGILRLQENQLEKPRNFEKQEKSKSRNIQPKQKEVSEEEEYIRGRAPRQGSRILERKDINKKKNPDLARRKGTYTRRGASWNQRNHRASRITPSLPLHYKRCTSLFAARPHPAYRLKGETCSTRSSRPVPGYSLREHTQGYSYVGKPESRRQRKHPVNWKLRKGEGSTDPQSGQKGIGRTQTNITHQEGRANLLNYLKKYFVGGLEVHP